MNVSNIKDGSDWFSVLQTDKKVQTAVMSLHPGASSGEKPEAHKESDQVLFVHQGEVTAEIDDDRKTMHQGDVIVIPAGVRHRFTNEGKAECITFNVYSPPEY